MGENKPAQDAPLVKVEDLGYPAPQVQPQPIVIRRPQPRPWRMERRTPRGQQTIEGNVAVPAAQAGITALVVFLLLCLATALLHWMWYVILFGTLAILLVTWLWRMDVATRLLWLVETLTHTDWNGDTWTGEPEHAFTAYNPAVARQEVERIAAPANDQRTKMLVFLHKCYAVGCSSRDHGISGTGPDLENYNACRDALLGLGLAVWKSQHSPRSGWIMKPGISEQQAAALIAEHIVG